MHKQNILRRVDSNIAAGELGTARQQLHTLINLYPYDLSLRRKLGDLYARLQYLERAGCYWYLEEKKSPQMERACAAFEKFCGGHPFVILRALKFRGGSESLPLGHARSVLEELCAHAPNYRYPEVKAAQIAAKASDTIGARVAESVLKIGCLVFIVMLLGIFLIGFYTIYNSGSEFFERAMR